jgi:hypothetical protein
MLTVQVFPENNQSVSRNPCRNIVLATYFNRGISQPGPGPMQLFQSFAFVVEYAILLLLVKGHASNLGLETAVDKSGKDRASRA